jgi:hypothetical protein
MRSHVPAMMFALAMLAAGSGQAQDNPVVVELFTSQGCSSCPPADDMFRDLARMDGVVALALHVDYWDYIGWKDSFAQPAFTLRQQNYARAAGERTVYTPQLIVGGLDRVVGADAMAVMDHLRAHAAAQTGITIDVTRQDGTIVIRADARPGPGEPMVVQLVRYVPEETVSIEQGENAGHRLTYVNIVTAWDEVALWPAGEPLTLTVPFDGTEPGVVIVQEQGFGRIMAAATLR